jgi:hypothetical protein
MTIEINGMAHVILTVSRFEVAPSSTASSCRNSG